MHRGRRGQEENQDREAAESDRQCGAAVDQDRLEPPAGGGPLSRITERRKHAVGTGIPALTLLNVALASLVSKRVKYQAHGSVPDRPLESGAFPDGADTTRAASRTLMGRRSKPGAAAFRRWTSRAALPTLG